MAKFIVILKDKRVGELTSELLEKHVEHLKKLWLDKRIFLCGPYKDSDSAIQILKAASVSEAEALIKSDPFIEQNYYRSYSLNELIEATYSNNFLLDAIN